MTHVDKLAMTTGKNPVPDTKQQWGYRFEPDKFGTAEMTPAPSIAVAPPRIQECPVQMEGLVHDIRPFGSNVNANAIEVHIVKLHVDESLLVGNGPRPHMHPSRLAESDFMRFVRNGTDSHRERDRPSTLPTERPR